MLVNLHQSNFEKNTTRAKGSLKGYTLRDNFIIIPIEDIVFRLFHNAQNFH